jgi:hypothetical protein
MFRFWNLGEAGGGGAAGQRTSSGSWMAGVVGKELSANYANGHEWDAIRLVILVLTRGEIFVGRSHPGRDGAWLEPERGHLG